MDIEIRVKSTAGIKSRFILKHPLFVYCLILSHENLPYRSILDRFKDKASDQN